MARSVRMNLTSNYTQEELGEWVKKIYSGNFLGTENGINTVSPTWGRSKNYFFDNTPIKKIISELDPKTILDYGCGESRVVENLQQEFPNIRYTKYDPYVERYKDYPSGQYDFIMCNLVVHLLNPEMKKYVIQELHRLNTGYVFISVLTLKNWQKNQFKDLFEICKCGETEYSPLEKLTDFENLKITSFLLKNI